MHIQGNVFGEVRGDIALGPRLDFPILRDKQHIVEGQGRCDFPFLEHGLVHFGLLSKSS